MCLHSRAESENEPRSHPCVSVAITGFVEAFFPPVAFAAAFVVFGAGFAFAFFEAVFGSGLLCAIGGFFASALAAVFALVAFFLAAGLVLAIICSLFNCICRAFLPDTAIIAPYWAKMPEQRAEPVFHYSLLT
jgi:hypothetical protein